MTATTPGPGIRLDNVVPFGRSLREYQRMFALSETEVRTRRILDAGGGPASFNAEVTALGGRVISADPLYHFSKDAIAQRIAETTAEVVAKCWERLGGFHFGPDADFLDPDDLGRSRSATMARFLEDYDAGLAEGRYRAESLPRLPLSDDSFDVALSSHLLFLYSDHLGWDFHRAAFEELLRLAPEVRVFPLIKLDASPTPFVQELERLATERGWTCERFPVPTRVQLGAHEALQVRRGA